MGTSLVASWTSLEKIAKKDLLKARNKIQYVFDLRAKLHTLGQLTEENLLQGQDHQSWLHNRDTQLWEFALGYKVLDLPPMSSSKLLVKWQGPFEVTQRVREVDYEVRQTDRGDAFQRYHLNFLKLWREVVPVALATVVPERKVLGLEVSLNSTGLHPTPADNAA